MSGRLRRWRERLLSLRHVAVLMAGTGIAQGIAILAAPVTSRLYDPSAFGLLGTLSTIASFVLVVASLRFETAIVLEAEEEWARHIFTLCLVLRGATLLLAAAGSAAAVLLGAGGPGVVDTLPLLAPWVALYGLQKIIEPWLVRRRALRPVAAGQVVRSAATLAAQVAAALAGFGWPGLILGVVVGQGLGVATTLAMGRAELREAFAHRPSRSQLRQAAGRHRQFLMYAAPQGLVSAFAYGLPILLLQSHYGAVAAGFFHLTNRILTIPVTVISDSVRPVFTRRAAELVADRPALYRHTLRTTALLALLVLPMVVVLAVGGPQVFAVVLGAKWQHAGEYARWLSIMLAAHIIDVPAVAVVPLLGMQGRFLVFECVFTVVRLAVLYLGLVAASDIAAIALFSVVIGLANAGLILYVGSRLAAQSRKTGEGG